jgi:hypothetical protein
MCTLDRHRRRHSEQLGLVLMNCCNSKNDQLCSEGLDDLDVRAVVRIRSAFRSYAARLLSSFIHYRPLSCD